MTIATRARGWAETAWASASVFAVPAGAAPAFGAGAGSEAEAGRGGVGFGGDFATAGGRLSLAAEVTGAAGDRQADSRCSRRSP